MRRSLFVAASLSILFCARGMVRADTLVGSSLVMQPNGATMSGTGFVGTYLSVPNVHDGGSDVDFTVTASHGAGGSNNPHLNLVIADAEYGFNVGSVSPTAYPTGSFFLPAGTYAVRVERDYVSPASASTRVATVNNLTVNGATFLNSGSSSTLNANALAAANTYINNFRKGDATVQLQGVTPGTPVSIDLDRHAFMFGTAVGGITANQVDQYLGDDGTALQTNYQSRIDQNFNTLVTGNAGKWSSNEATRDVITMSNVDMFISYTQARNMRLRMHNTIWATQQPNWANTLLSQAATGNTTAKNDLRTEISERIDYHVGNGSPADRAKYYGAVDVYNESYHSGSQTAGSYWNVYGATGIADIYREIRDSIAATGANSKTFVNEFNVFQDGGDSYANWYKTHIDSLRNAGHTAGYGEVLGGIGIQYYPNPDIGTGNDDHYPHRIMQTLLNLSAEGLPVTLTEYGGKAGASQATATQMLDESMRLMFGSPSADGFVMWGFWSGDVYQPATAFYDSSWNITEPGKKWQDLLGIQDWDGNPNNAWTTHVSSAVSAGGEIDFNGFYGEYKVTIEINGTPVTLRLNLEKGQTNYSLLPGDFNDDGQRNATDVDLLVANMGKNSLIYDLSGNDVVDIDDKDILISVLFETQYGDADLDGGVGGLDYTAWRLRAGTGWAHGDFDGDGGVGGLDYTLWRTRPTSYPGPQGAAASGLAAVPEPTSIVLFALGLTAIGLLSRPHSFNRNKGHRHKPQLCSGEISRS